MSAPIEELTEKAKEMKIHSKNWNDLPVEMKFKCIGKMDFKTRTLLRSTSKSDRQMVDSVKHLLDFLRLDFVAESTKFSVLAKSKEEQLVIKFSEDEEENRRRIDLSVEEQKFGRVLQFLKQILERSKIANFEIKITCAEKKNKDLKLIREMVESGPPLQISQLGFGWQPDSTLELAILKKCDADLNVIHMWTLFYGSPQDVKEYVNIPQVFAATKTILTSVHKPSDQQWREVWIQAMTLFVGNLNRWVTENATIGKEVCWEDAPQAAYTALELMYPDNIISKNDENTAFRLRTADVDKHVWIRMSPRDQYLQCFTVAANSADPDFREMDRLRLGDRVVHFERMRVPNMLEEFLGRFGIFQRAEPYYNWEFDEDLM